MPTAARTKSRKARALSANCKAKREFTNSPGGPCVSCKCKDHPPSCRLYPYKPRCCPKGKARHHVIPVHCFMPAGERTTQKGVRYKGCENYDPDKAPCICLKGSGKTKDHGKVHKKLDKAENEQRDNNDGTWTYRQAKNAAARSVSETNGCSEACIKAQLDDYHKNRAGIGANTKLRADATGKGKPPKIPTRKVQVEG